MSETIVPEQDVLAIVAGKPYTKIPSDLFIPPDALKILLESFSGPLDLLLYLIRRQDIDIFDIPMSKITQQYMLYIELMEKNRLELAADYLVMAAWLAEIKSRMLLPKERVLATDEPEEDPRLTLVKRLQEYEQIKALAQWVEQLPRCDREVFPVHLSAPKNLPDVVYPEVTLAALMQAMGSALKRKSHLEHHVIAREPLSVQERMDEILHQLAEGSRVQFTALLDAGEGRMGVVVTFLALLELSRQSLIQITQDAGYSTIYARRLENDVIL